MKSAAFAVLTLTIAVMTTTLAFAQPPGGRDGPGGRGPGGRNGAPTNLVLEALDTNGDHAISAEEIANAATALKKLDANNDGQIAGDELRPVGPPGERGPAGRGAGFGGPRGGPRGNATSFAERIMEFDENGDGKVTKEELPERMQAVLARIDKNNDGSLDKSELDQMATQFGQRRSGNQRGRSAGEGGPRGFGGPGGRPGFGGPGGPGGPPSPEQFVERAMTFDGDKDGKLSKDELEQMAAGFARRGGPGGRRGGRPGGGDRPQRPSRAE